MSGKLNITIEQGATFSKTITYTDSDSVAISLVGATGLALLRKDYSSTVSFPFTVTITNGLGGVLTLVMPAAMTATIPITNTDRYVYDLLLTMADGSLVRLLEGKATVTPSVSR